VPAAAPTITVPNPSIVVLVGPAGCGKSTFAAQHFSPAEVLSSDAFRELVAGDAADQGASPAAFSLLRHALDERAKRRRLTVVDATNLTRRERRRFLAVARRYALPSIAVAVDLPLEVCRQRATERADRVVTPAVVERQHAALKRQLDAIGDEGFDEVAILRSVDEVDGAAVRRDPVAPTPAPATPGTPAGEASFARTATTDDTAAPRPPAVVVDLDGTLTSAAWREHHLTGRRKDWPAFFAGMERDAPVQPLVELVGWIANHAAVVLLTGRPDDHAPAIRRWLATHGVTYDQLLMRPGGDRRPDTVVKRELYVREVAPRYDVRLVIDDRPHVVEMWREAGLYVLTAVDPRLDPFPEFDGT
jgi:predicted kinase